MKAKILLCLLLSSLALMSHAQNYRIKLDKKEQKVCNALNDSAMAKWMAYFATSDSLKIDTALMLIDDAIACNPTLVSAYEYKITIENHRKDYKGALETLNKMPEGYKNSTYMLLKKGILLKKLNKVDSASHIFKLAYDRSIEEQKLEPHNVDIKLNHLLCVAIIKGKEQALKEYEVLRKKYESKENEDVEIFQSVLETFDINSFEL